MPDQEGCYLAEPSGPGRGGVLVVHDWYGLLPHVRTLCDGLAAAGLVATAPDLYDGRTASLARHRALVRQRRRGPVRPNPGRRGLVDHRPVPPRPPGFAVAQRRPRGHGGGTILERVTKSIPRHERGLSRHPKGGTRSRLLFPLTTWIPALQPAPTRRCWQEASCTWRSGMAARRTVAAVQTERVLRLVREVLGQDALGAYEHGSAVLGGVQPTSDIDILVITGRLATLVEKRQLVKGLMTISAPFPPPGRERCVELTVVAQAQVRPWRYPPGFDLQYGEWLRKRFERGDSLPLQAAVNADLTILLTIVLLGDQPLFGPPPGALLDPVLMEDCINAMVSDIDVFMDEFEGDTCNILLRLARIWQTVVTGSIDRKDRAAEWAQERLPPDYQQLMERARAMYLGWQPDGWAGLASEARAGADYMISQIRREAARRRPGQVLRLASG